MSRPSGRLPVRSSALGMVLFLALGPARAQELAVSLEAVAGGMDQPIGIEHADDGSGRLFVIEQPGRVRIVDSGALLSQAFLDVTTRVTTTGNEQGLLGLAFHPDYASNGVFFIHYTEDTAGDTVIERCTVSSGDSNAGDCSAEDIIFTLPQPAANHNGGKIAFGPDGFLYIALGDGGGGGDPGENAQDITDLHGKLLRLDVDGDDFTGDPDRDYAVPADNPFVGQTGADEIWAFGLRNPWRFSFDRMTGDIWIGDVGQQDWEEIDFEPAGDPGGRNYGWDVLEGTHCYTGDAKNDDLCAAFQSGASTLPVVEIDSSGTGNCSVTGGYRYRGTTQPELYGFYVYGDFCSGRIWGVLPDCTGGWTNQELADTGNRIASFGEDESGELYLVDRSDGTLYRVVADATGARLLTAKPDVIPFGEHAVGDIDMREVQFQHTGAGPDNLQIDAFDLSDAHHFVVDVNGGSTPCGAPPVSLSPGQSCSADMIFGPDREGGFDEILCVSGNLPSRSISLRATVPCTEVDHRLIEAQTVSGTEFLYACQTITGGDGFTVADGGRAELRAGVSVSLQPGASVALGGALGMVVDPVLAQP